MNRVKKINISEIYKIFESDYTKMLIQRGKIDVETLSEILDIDPTRTKKYTNWLCKMYIQRAFNPNDLKLYIETYDSLANKNKIKDDEKDINKFESIDEFIQFVNKANQNSPATQSELENDYEVVMDTNAITIFVPHTHEASRKLGMKYFKVPGTDNCKWCTTYKGSNHWDEYYHLQNVTIYYILVKDERLEDMLKNNFGEYALNPGFSILVGKNGIKSGYDNMDDEIEKDDIENILYALGLK